MLCILSIFNIKMFVSITKSQIESQRYEMKQTSVMRGVSNFNSNLIRADQEVRFLIMI